MIPESWTKALVDFWNGPWRTVLIIGLATVAAVAITVALPGVGVGIGAMLLAGVIGRIDRGRCLLRRRAART